ncbi:MAG: hypothetical protein GY859_19685, partial [Desulfobacterales bacterium]|nr:hypothetical protein [Desulfobacterales bacterium]
MEGVRSPEEGRYARYTTIHDDYSLYVDARAYHPTWGYLEVWNDWGGPGSEPNLRLAFDDPFVVVG